MLPLLLLPGLPAAAQTADVDAAAQRVTRFVRARQAGAALPGAQALQAARQQHLRMMQAAPRASNLSVPWTPVGPAQVGSALYGAETGRVTSLVLDPADASGNTFYVGTTGGGVWKSVNAAGPAAAVTFVPLTDTLPVYSANAGTMALPSLSIGALGMANGVLLAGTGDPNDATDSLYGEGILRSSDGGATWTLTQTSSDPYSYSFTGLAVAGFAFSSANPALAVAALTQSAEGTLVNAPDANFSVKGLYYSADAGLTWHLATVLDGAAVVQSPQQPGANNGGNAATAVVWNAVRRRFYAALQFHGYYESADGMVWTRLANQPAAALTATACPPNPQAPGAASCPIFRGALAVQPVTGDTFALTTDRNNIVQGLQQDVCVLSGTACAGGVQFGKAIATAPLEAGSATHAIAQADYNLVLAAVASGPDTRLYVGTTDVFACTLTAGAGSCALRNTTNAQNGCLFPAGVAPAQHALLALGSTLFVGNDGGLYRSSDAVAQTGAVCSASDAAHFDNLNGGLGSLAEVVSLAQHPSDAKALLVGLGALGTAATANAAGSWPQVAAGEGGTVAIDPVTPQLWYLSRAAAVNVALCTRGSACTASDFTATIGPAQVAADPSLIHAPWLLDPAAPANLLVGTCRAWRGPAAVPAAWTGANAIGRPFGASAASACSLSFPYVRSLAAGGAAVVSGNAQSAGSAVLYAGLAGTQDGGGALGGHVFVTAAAGQAGNTTVWTDAGLAPVTNDTAAAGVFNPGGFEVSSVTVDTHDATGRTAYVTAMGFRGNGVKGSPVYRTVDGGAHWTNIAANLPNAPANALAVDPNDANTVYIAMDTGVYASTQVASCAASDCWSVYGAGLPNAPAVQLLAGAGLPTGDGRLGELRVGTYGRGVWQIPLLTAISPAAPAIALTPASLTFAAQAVGTQSAAQTLTVTNTGTAPLVIASIVPAGDFAVASACSAAPVAQGAACTIDVRFAPTASGARTGQVTVYANVAGGQAVAALSGTGTPPAAIVLTPSSLSFPATIVGASSAAQVLTVANTGGAVANLQAPTLTADFKLASSTCASTLGPQSSCSLSVAFAPSTAGARGGTLTLVDDAGTQVANLSGTGTTPATDALAPLALTFAATQVGTTSATQNVTLSNAGDVPLVLIAASIAAGDFSVVNNCGTSLAAHSTCTFAVAYVPKSAGATAGILTVADQFRSQTVALRGTGLAPPGVSLLPAGPLAFGPLGVGLVSASQTVTLTNNGGVPLAIAGLALSGDFTVVANACGATLAPAAACTVTLAFAPAQVGVRSGALTVTSNAPGSPQAVTLGGTGVDFTLTASGATSATLTSGKAASFGLLLTGAAGLPVGSGLPGNAAFTCSGVPAHALCTVSPASTGLAGTTPITVTVATGVLTGALGRPAFPWQKPLIFCAALTPLLLLRRRRGAVPLLAVLASLLLTACTGCSTGRLVPGDGTTTTVTTPAGTYGLVVAASSAGLVRSVSLTVVVQ